MYQAVSFRGDRLNRNQEQQIREADRAFLKERFAKSTHNELSECRTIERFYLDLYTNYEDAVREVLTSQYLE